MEHIANEVDAYLGDGRQMNTFADFSPLPVLCSCHKGCAVPFALEQHLLVWNRLVVYAS